MEDRIETCVDKTLEQDVRIYSTLLNSYKERTSNLLTDGLNELTQNVLNESLKKNNIMPILYAGTDTREKIFELALNRGVMWAVGKSLRIKFLRGARTLWQITKSVAPEWTKHANLNFIFIDDTDDGDADIRIAFDAGRGNWSYVGTDCKSITDQNEPTMNLDSAGFIIGLEAFAGTILHEFGHAIGCIHEHQSPDANIPWNKQAVYDYYKKSDGWSQAKVDHNLFPKYDASEDITNSQYDSKSIMHYPIDPSHVTNPKFASGWNHSLSQQDINFIKSVYPGRN